MDKDIIVKTLPEALQKKNTLLKGLFSGEISMAEFNKECAHWFISCNDFAPLLLPTRPGELLEYDSWSSQEKKNTSDKFWRQNNISKYLNQKQYVISRNRSMLGMLKTFKEYLSQEDPITRAKYDNAINEYIDLSDIVNKAIDTFGGTVERRCKDESF